MIPFLVIGNTPLGDIFNEEFHFYFVKNIKFIPCNILPDPKPVILNFCNFPGNKQKYFLKKYTW